MARIRTIKPKHVEDKMLPTISLQAHLSWILMWPFSDDKGVIEDDPLFIKSQIFPRRLDVSIKDIEEWVCQLEKAGFIIKFDYQSSKYLLHRTFLEHQKIDKPNESKIPASLISELIDGYSENVRRKVAPIEESRVEERRVEESMGDSARPEILGNNFKKSKNKKTAEPGPAPFQVEMPFTSEIFRASWQQWKDYKKGEFRKSYKTAQSEQSALLHLAEISGGDEIVAINIIKHSMANTWQGLFPLKSNDNGQSKSGGNKAFREQLNQMFTEQYGKK